MYSELAGEGIEYAWGAAKLDYRRNNDGKASNFHTRVRNSLAIVTRKKAFKFQRRARSYRRALSDPGNFPLYNNQDPSGDLKVTGVYSPSLNLKSQQILRTVC